MDDYGNVLDSGKNYTRYLYDSKYIVIQTEV